MFQWIKTLLFFDIGDNEWNLTQSDVDRDLFKNFEDYESSCEEQELW